MGEYRSDTKTGNWSFNELSEEIGEITVLWQTHEGI